jgi:predicted enzyme related to lactoylglutathione lyase
MEVNEYTPGTPCWVDIASPDIAATAAFYTALFGWGATDLGPDAGNYHMFDVGGKIVAAGGPQMDGDPSPPHWTTYICVADAAETVSKIEANGGTVLLAPMAVMEAGTMAIASDPKGGVFAIWQPGTTKGAQLVNDPNTWCWNELTTRDADELLEFYTAVFGWSINKIGGGGFTYREIQVNGRRSAGCMEMDDNFPAQLPTHWLTYFAVTDCDESAAKAESLGGHVHVSPTDLPVGRFSVLQDPAGAAFAIITLLHADTE